MGYVDFDSIVKDCDAGKKALESMKSFHGTRQQEITAKESAIVEMEKTYDQQKYTLSSEARERRLYELEQQKLELKRFLEDSEREMEKLNKKYIEPIRDEVFEYIKKYGDDNGYGIIFDKTRSTLIYTNDDLDLTQKIISLYNQAYAAKSLKK
jgi:outer membrane protein